ncbi:MAG TPA: hypothetical protein VL282_13670 [Tepidisphaeraceae bacterium]|jgi:hypothetical protein|nr:hypothetical protein [Tepidisphaeraceae bacterium]
MLALAGATLLCVMSIAQGQPAASQPVTLDLSSPKSAAKSLVQAVEAGDGDALKKIMLSEGPDQEHLASAFSDVIVAGKKLSDAARVKFGAAGEAMGQGMITNEDIAKIDTAQVDEKGDKATLTIAGQAKPMNFQKKDDQWKLQVMDFAGAQPDSITKQRSLLGAVAHALNEAAEEISSGRYANVKDAEAAVTAKLNNVMVKNFQPTSAPTSKPS